MRKTLNGKSSRCVVSKERNCHRLKAVSDYSFCEVRPGVGPVRKKDNIIPAFFSQYTLRVLREECG